jgi:peptidyl-prolyl cis-trans isomerase A (cyclophilin A)
MNTRLAVLLAAGLALAGSCRRAEKEAASTPPPAAAASPSATPAALPPLRDPARAVEQAPEQFKVRFETTKGPFVVEVTRAWAPRGADRFYNLVRLGYYDDVVFFRVIRDFMAQFGIHADPAVSAVWREARIPDDPVTQSNRRGMVTFATAGPDTRTTQLFINFKDNANLDGMGFAPFGRVVEGMAVVDALHSGYGEGAPRGTGPDQGRAQAEGNAYIKGSFPKLDSIKTARLVAP